MLFASACATAAATDARVPAAVEACARYVVEGGEPLGTVAQRFGLTPTRHPLQVAYGPQNNAHFAYRAADAPRMPPALSRSALGRPHA